MTERAIFEAAIEITDTAQREAFLNEACAGDAALRERLDALLASHGKASQFLSVPAVDQIQPPGDEASSQTTMMPKSAASQAREDDGGDSERNAGPDISFLQPSSKPGSIGLLGHYEILQVLGRGAFGVVFKAFDEKLHRMVAIKVMNPALAATSPPRKRFLREARSSAAVRHENIVAIHAVEEQPVPYLVMEYIPGKTLQQWQDEHGPLDPVDILKFGQQIAAGLAAAHAQGLIHRDIKPANILLDTSIETRIKITDFGLARAVDDASMTQSGLIAGTPMYMAPEQARGQTLDHRADLFSLGTVLYTMASGRPPFRASNTIAVLKRVCEDTPRPVSEVIPGSPLWLDEIIAKLHAKEPDDRFQTAKEVADLLARCQSELQLNGQVTCITIQHDAPASGRDESRPPKSSPHVPREESRTSTDANRATDIALPTMSTPRSAYFTRSVKATFAAVIGIAVLAAITFKLRDNDARRMAAPGHPSDTLPNAKKTAEGGHPTKATGWHGWPADAPPPAIAPFDAEQAKQHQEAWAKYLGVPVEYTNSLGMKFRLIPPGEFLMGSTAVEIEEALNAEVDKTLHSFIKREGPQHKVILTKPNYLGIHEVTQAEYEKVMEQNPSHFAPMGAGKEAVNGMKTTDHPVETVSWNDAAEFCSKLSEREKLTPFKFELRAGETMTIAGTGYRLPTEAEWEYACRAGTATKYWFGNKDDDLVRAGWFHGNSGFRTHKVGELKANPLGLYDIHGNVWEWVQDGWDPTFYGQFQETPAIDPNSPFFAGSSRVIRGGHLSAPALFCRASSSRFDNAPSERTINLGFRVSLMVDAVKQALKVDGAKIVKPGVPVGANGNPVAEQGRSAWDDLDPAQIPEAERVPFQPKELVAVLGEHRQRHWQSVYSAAIRADGKQAATCTQDGIRFGDLQTFQEQAHLSVLNTPELPLGTPVSLLYTPDGRSLLVGHVMYGSDSPLVSEIDVSVLPPRLARSWKLPNNLYGNTFLSEISPSGRFLSGRGDYHGKGFLLERTETELKPVAEFPDTSRISFAPDEKSVALTTRTGGTVRLLGFQDNKLTEKAVLTGSATEVADQPMSPLRDAKFSPDGRLLVIDAKFVPWFFDVSGAEPKPLFKLDRTAFLPSFSKEGRSLLVRNDDGGGGLHLWSIIDDQAKLVSSTDIRVRVPRHGTFIVGDNIFASDLALDGKLAITGHDNGIVRFLDVASPDVTELQPVKPNPVAFGHSYARPLRIGVNGVSILSEESLGVLTWHLENGRLQRKSVVDAGLGNSLAASEDGSLLVTWETPPSRCVIRRREQNEWRAIRTVPSTIEARCGALSHDQRRLVIGSNIGEIELWDLEAKPPRKLWTHKTPQNQYVVRLHFAMKDSLLVSEVYGTAVVQRITDTGLEPFFTVPTAGYQFTDVAPNGESMALASLHALSTWSLTSDPPQQIQQLLAPQAGIEPRSVAYSPDGRQLAVAYANGQIWLHDLETGTVSRKLQLPGGVRHVLFTTDNRHLITANGNGTIYVVRLEPAPKASSK